MQLVGNIPEILLDAVQIEFLDVRQRLGILSYVDNTDGGLERFGQIDDGLQFRFGVVTKQVSSESDFQRFLKIEVFREWQARDSFLST